MHNYGFSKRIDKNRVVPSSGSGDDDTSSSKDGLLLVNNNINSNSNYLNSNSSKSTKTIPKKISKAFTKIAKDYFQMDAFDDEKIILEELLREQTIYVKKDNLFNFVLQNDLKGLQSRLEEEKNKIILADKKLIENDIDPTGATIIHIAYMFKKFEIGRWLVENYPEQGFLPYGDASTAHDFEVDREDMPYSGQNILHIAIVNKDIGEIRWLLEFYSKHKMEAPLGLEILLNTGTRGRFFALETKDFYCGCYPIHFAAGSNCPEIFDLILNYFTSVSSVNKKKEDAFKEYTATDELMEAKNDGTKASAFRLKFSIKYIHMNPGNNAIFMRDQYGNNCLHICVIYRLDNMYKHIKESAKSILRKEIKHAFESTTSYTDKTPLSIRALPSWDVLKDNKESQPHKLKSMASFSVHWREASNYNPEVNNESINQTEYIDGSISKLLKRISKVIITLFHHYIPFYKHFCVSRLKRENNTQKVLDNDLDNGFYFGYSPNETIIYFPIGEEKLSLELQSKWLENVVQKKIEERFEWVLNENFHSPLTLTSAGNIHNYFI